jgi:hypothetical protein
MAYEIASWYMLTFLCKGTFGSIILSVLFPDNPPGRNSMRSNPTYSYYISQPFKARMKDTELPRPSKSLSMYVSMSIVAAPILLPKFTSLLLMAA